VGPGRPLQHRQEPQLLVERQTVIDGVRTSLKISKRVAQLEAGSIDVFQNMNLIDSCA